MKTQRNARKKRRKIVDSYMLADLRAAAAVVAAVRRCRLRIDDEVDQLFFQAFERARR